eukprot:m.119300 g.119300  ORF g.119300 m.119300 type:complete len:67 (+) comp13286_c0_seq1:1459-1659(+)
MTCAYTANFTQLPDWSSMANVLVEDFSQKPTNCPSIWAKLLKEDCQSFFALSLFRLVHCPFTQWTV